MLHTVNKSPFDTHDLHNCARFVDAGDVLLLLEDGVYAAQAGTVQSHLVADMISRCAVYALQADLAARGISDLIPGVALADYDKFVDLVEQHKVQAWL
ncbi:MAG: tRNA 2-thiouridine synthesizing protein [Pseudomonadota bacterium]|nr:tRNA 2-thiouridine synthesizing protein [Pseudomonadota bacterium]